MVCKMTCECKEHYEAKINSMVLFKEVKCFFEKQVRLGIFNDIPVETPFFIGYSEIQNIEWYATKWYKCNACGCLWEFDYPDFPAEGFVRKFEDGKYTPQRD